MKKANIIFFEVFAGEFVEIVTDLQVTQSMRMDEEGHVTPLPAIPMMVNGFVMDLDEKFIYLSADGESVNQALPLLSIKHIIIQPVKTELEQLLDEIPEPDEDGSYH